MGESRLGAKKVLEIVIVTKIPHMKDDQRIAANSTGRRDSGASITAT
jgi:hypothetical protein